MDGKTRERITEEKGTHWVKWSEGKKTKKIRWKNWKGKHYKKKINIKERKGEKGNAPRPMPLDVEIYLVL